jgi:hypothetical protein
MSAIRYEDTIYDGHTITIKVFDADDPNLPNPEDFDLYFSSSLSTIGYRDAKGEWVRCKDRYPKGIGAVCVKIIHAIMLNPGRNLDRDQMASKAKHPALAEKNGNLLARVFKIRKVFGYHFIETSRIDGYHIRWPKGQTWIWREILNHND